MAATSQIKRDRIVENLRRRILSGELPRGSRMPQDELARHYGASITPVREALRLLEAEGLLVSQPHRGVRVAGIGLDQIKGTYVVRRLVESYAMRRAVSRLSPRDLSRVRGMVASMEGASVHGDLEEFRTDNRAFHFFFYERCGMPALTQQIEAMWQAFPWDLMLTSADRTRQSHHEHLAILTAVEGGDVDAVAEATEHHIAEGFKSIASGLLESSAEIDDPFSIDVD